MNRNPFLCAVVLCAVGIARAGSTDTLVVSTDTVVNSANQSTVLPMAYHNATISADFTLDGAFLTNGWKDATVTVGSPDRRLMIAVTNAVKASWMTYHRGAFVVTGRGATFHVHAKTAPDLGWVWRPSEQADKNFLGDQYTGNAATLGRDGRFAIQLDTLPDGGVLDFAHLYDKGSLGLASLTNATANLTARILFDGGNCMIGFDGMTLFNLAADNSKIRLESVGDKPIFIRHLYAATTFSNADGETKRLETAGNGDFVVGPGNSTPGIFYLVGAVDWGHGGDNYLIGPTQYKFRQDNFFPHGEGAGKLYLLRYSNKHQLGTDYYSATDKAVQTVDLYGTTQKVNSFVQDDDKNYPVKYCVTNSATARATLEVGEYGVQTELSGYFYGPIDICKKGSGTTTIARRTYLDRNVALSLDAGTTLVTTNLSVGTLKVAPGARLVVDGATVVCRRLESDGAVETRNGGRVYELCEEPGETVLRPNLASLSGHYRIASGTFYLNGNTCTNEYWRYVLKSIGSSTRDSDAEMMRLVLLDTTNTITRNEFPTANALSTGLSAVGTKTMGSVKVTSATAYFTNYYYATEIAASSLEPGQVTLRPNAWWAEGLNGRTWKDVSSLFTASMGHEVFNPCNYDRLSSSATHVSFNETKPETWIDITWRLKSGMNKVRSYSLCASGWSSADAQPYAFELQTSADGVTWLTADARTGISGQKYFDFNAQGDRTHYSIWYDDGRPFVLNGEIPKVGAVGFAASACVQVDADGVLDASGVRTDGGESVQASLSSLIVDQACGMGTFRNVAFASGGTLNLIGTTAKPPRSLELTPTFENCDPSGLNGWTLTYNGRPTRGGFVRYEGGKLILGAQPGMMVIVR